MSDAYLFYVSFAGSNLGLGLEGPGLALGTAGRYYKPGKKSQMTFGYGGGGTEHFSGRFARTSAVIFCTVITDNKQKRCRQATKVLIASQKITQSSWVRRFSDTSSGRTWEEMPAAVGLLGHDVKIYTCKFLHCPLYQMFTFT